MRWDRIIEEKIRAAQAEGKFDALPSQGRPLQLDENPFEDPAWQMAHHLLKQSGFRPDWLEEDVLLRQKLADARAALVRARDWRAAQREAGGGPIAAEWDRAVGRFRAAIEQINQGIARMNMRVPHERLQRRKLVADDELRKVLAA